MLDIIPCWMQFLNIVAEKMAGEVGVDMI